MAPSFTDQIAGLPLQPWSVAPSKSVVRAGTALTGAAEDLWECEQPPRSRLPASMAMMYLFIDCHPDGAERAQWRACPERTPNAHEGESNGDLLFRPTRPRRLHLDNSHIF